MVDRILKPNYYYYLVLCASSLHVLSLTAWNCLADLLLLFFIIILKCYLSGVNFYDALQRSVSGLVSLGLAEGVFTSL